MTATSTTSVTPTLGAVLYGFIEHYLKAERGLAVASIRSYRDVLRLFLAFVAQTMKRPITRLTIADLTHVQVRAFLMHLETARGNHVRTRNQRLALLHTFFTYLAGQVPEACVEAERVAAVPRKRAPAAPTQFLERDEVEGLFAQLPTVGPHALRDRALLLFLYNTGARAQEVADLRAEHLVLAATPRAQLHGKGDKWRTCPLWPETARLIGLLLDARPSAPRAPPPVAPTGPVFTTARGTPLTRYGIHKLVRRHTRTLITASGRPVSPHVFRHTTAVHLLEAGVEVNVIRGWLGHVSLDTTHRYAEINMRMKTAALAACEAPVSATAGFPRRPVWRDDPSLLAWLESL
jgi:site-specific recombinase XerD